MLDKIVATKAQQISTLKLTYPPQDIQPTLVPSTRSLFDALRSEPASFILECKKASPSKGLIRESFDLELIIEGYRHYASAVSVLTDQTSACIIRPTDYL